MRLIRAYTGITRGYMSLIRAYTGIYEAYMCMYEAYTGLYEAYAGIYMRVVFRVMRFVNLRGRRLTKRCSHTRSAWGGGRREGRVERMSQGTAVCFRRESSACHFFAVVSIEAVVSMGKESVWWRIPERVECGVCLSLINSTEGLGANNQGSSWIPAQISAWRRSSCAICCRERP